MKKYIDTDQIQYPCLYNKHLPNDIHCKTKLCINCVSYSPIYYQQEVDIIENNNIKEKVKADNYKSNKYPPLSLCEEMLSKGDRVIHKGYYYITYGKYHTYEHRLVMYSLGVKMRNNVHVHHIDLDKLNNSVDNLMLIPRLPHYRLHRMIKENNLVEINKLIRFYINYHKK